MHQERMLDGLRWYVFRPQMQDAFTPTMVSFCHIVRVVVHELEILEPIFSVDTP